MATVEGLMQRGSRYSLLVLIPKDLQDHYGRKRVVTALGTSDRAKAVEKGLLLKAEWLQKFEAKRKELNPQALEVITPELAQVFADGARRRVLQMDQDMREGKNTSYTTLMGALFRAVHKQSLRRLYMGTPPPDWPTLPERVPLGGLPEWEADAIKAANAERSNKAGEALRRWNLLHVLPELQLDAKALGFTITEETKGLEDALTVYLKAYRLALHEATQRDAGEVVETPVAPPLTASPKTATGAPRGLHSGIAVIDGQPPIKGKTLRDIYDLWLKASPRTTDNAQACSRALKLAEEHLGSPLYVEQVTRAQGATFRAWLQEPERKTKPKTAKDRLMYVNALLAFAAQDLEVIAKNPWEGLLIEVQKGATRRDWKSHELQKLFSQPLFQAYEIPPKGRSGGGPAAYWIPLLGLYTGARIGELAQLRVSDITEDTADDGTVIPIIRITDEGEGQSVKTAGSKRSIPIHSELIRLGLLDYAEEVRKEDPNGSLWPLLKPRTTSAWFSKYRKSIPGLDGEWLDFHSLRHTVRTRMARAKVPEKTMDAITGHTDGGSTGRKVYTHLCIEDLKQAVERLSYDLALQRVYPSRATSASAPNSSMPKGNA